MIMMMRWIDFTKLLCWMLYKQYNGWIQAVFHLHIIRSWWTLMNVHPVYVQEWVYEICNKMYNKLLNERCIVMSKCIIVWCGVYVHVYIARTNTYNVYIVRTVHTMCTLLGQVQSLSHHRCSMCTFIRVVYS